MVNNEFTYTKRGSPTPGKTFTFRADPAYASYLIDMGADLVSLANNHSYDYGEVSLTDTLDTLQSIGMPYVGAGRNLEEAVKPVSFIAGDVKIAFLSATQIERVDNPDTKGRRRTRPEYSAAGTWICCLKKLQGRRQKTISWWFISIGERKAPQSLTGPKRNRRPR